MSGSAVLGLGSIQGYLKIFQIHLAFNLEMCRN